jgi:acetate kinase
MNVLVVNCGSSSLKCQLIDMVNENFLAKGVIEEIGGKAKYSYQKNGFDKIKKELSCANHEDALKLFLNDILSKDNNIGAISSIGEISAIGHRVVHGGERFKSAVIIDEEVIKVIEECSDLAPLHNPANLIGINACKKELPSKPMVGVFDTAFHQTMSKEAFIYPIPYEYYEKYHIRKYGFHGPSHKYVSYRAAEILGKNVNELNIITCHLGNGSSLCAVKKGKSINTSMGFTPLAGTMMGTRSGDIDPSIIFYLAKKENLSLLQVENILNKKSGLLGIFGESSDNRDAEIAAWQKGNQRAQLALDKFSYTVKEYLGSFAALMDGLDVIVFTGGVGEKSPETREYVCRNMKHFGIELDLEKNKIKGEETIISSNNSNVKVIVIPTNEELMIARETKDLVIKRGRGEE